ncbi:MAG: ABC transporter ATP-binding protein [Mariprofundales bacterium]
MINDTPLFTVQNINLNIAVGHLWWRRQIQVLNKVSFTVNKAESVAYLGANGAGKTSTFRAICGLATQCDGILQWCGKTIHTQELHQYIGFLPEHPYFYRELTPYELLLGLGRIMQLSHHDVRQAIIYWSEQLDFANILHQRIKTCSKGQVQRVGLAQALLHRPQLLILDEPMSGLDPIGRQQVRHVLQEVHKQGTALLFSSHVLADAESLCQRVIALAKGKVIFDGDVKNLLQDPHNWFIHLEKLANIPTSLPSSTKILSQTDGSIMLIGNQHEKSLNAALLSCLQHDQCHIIASGHRRPRLEDAFVELVQSQQTKVVI